METLQKIEELTPEQEASLDAIAEEWIQVGLSTAPTNERRARAAIKEAYRCAGEKVPRHITFHDSPIAALLAVEELGDRVGARVWDRVRDRVRDRVGARVGDRVGDRVRDRVRDRVWARVWARVGDRVWDRVWARVRDRVRDRVWDFIYGQHDAGWLSYYATFRSFGFTEEAQELTGLMALAREAHWVLTYEHHAFIVRRPVSLLLDEHGDLHGESAPALAYADGFALYAWHGVDVPELVIEHPEQITVAMIEQEQNAEVRRVMIERYGADRYIRDSGAVKLHRDDYGTLWKKEVPDDEAIVMVEVVNGTQEQDGSYHHYFLRVPPDMTTAWAAVAWTYGLTPETYYPVIRT